MNHNISVPNKINIKNIYESFNPLLLSITQNIEEKLKNTIKIASMPTYKSRIKSFNSYYRKILRTKAQDSANTETLIPLTDMMGIRIICAFLEDLSEVESQVKENFTVKEVEYKGSGENFKEFGYESVHILIAIPDDCIPDDANKKLPSETVCEIQIRTILQDAWAEVEHELIYKSEFTPFDMPLRRKLASINASLSLADTIFQEIRDYQKKLHLETFTRRESFYGKVDKKTADMLGFKPTEKKEVPRISPFIRGTIDDLVLEALHAHNTGNLKEAIEIYSRILNFKPELSDQVQAVIYKHRGMAFFAASEYDSALSDFEKSVSFDSEAFRTFYYIGIVYSVKENYKCAVENFTKSLKINDFQSHAHYRRAIAYSKNGDYFEALSDLSAADSLGLNDEKCKELRNDILKKINMKV